MLVHQRVNGQDGQDEGLQKRYFWAFGMGFISGPTSRMQHLDPRKKSHLQDDAVEMPLTSIYIYVYVYTIWVWYDIYHPSIETHSGWFLSSFCGR